MACLLYLDHSVILLMAFSFPFFVSFEMFFFSYFDYHLFSDILFR